VYFHAIKITPIREVIMEDRYAAEEKTVFKDNSNLEKLLLISNAQTSSENSEMSSAVLFEEDKAGAYR
jgi:hypothetical protein